MNIDDYLLKVQLTIVFGLTASRFVDVHSVW